MQRIIATAAALALVVSISGAAHGQLASFVFDETFDATVGTWQVSVTVSGATSGLSAYAFDVVDIDFNHPPIANENAWTQDINLGFVDGGFNASGFVGASQGIVGANVSYAVGGNQDASAAIFGVGISQQVDPGITGRVIEVPAILGVLDAGGTDFINVGAGLYGPDAEQNQDPTDFLPDSQVQVEIIRIIPEPASLALLGLGGLCLLARRR